ncbi:KEOPS complex subunit Pcc1 [Methermicoccus shengliensis]|uniref:KEOPS complex subunit Pcc1 n=1 Tax=Methermicoccus shengliensis TaxID=660064 RepID=A0A832VXM1_9EURY|nr:KEOPS complex subunit Pcc1 [Methermicoccus shengliensis]KUK04941.1 MAG: hypothetical protein XD46_0287 [Euryarchaeota archaeon 55_53]KUK30900.1 MAG: hypothetical protein XD62_0042 [Methanosarcinales archeaon 56_1174]MDI3487639.1 hypothetical protein [Methanosarcinales archaeon]MDN5294972.1 hypothetical protein [Methanosarcinales archaeon]HIH69977.1 hypothetical protein [Methermicoccus shengliensis]
MEERAWAKIVFSELAPHERLAIEAVSVDNTSNMQCEWDDEVALTVECSSAKSLLATLDDYLRCLQVSLGMASAVGR